MEYSECNSYRFIDFRIEGTTGILELNSPNNRNALCKEMMHELIHFFESTQQDASFTTLILKGKDHFFSSGADLNWMLEATQKELPQNIRDAKLFHHLYYSQNNYLKPIICMVEKGAYGGAIGLMACSDVVLCDQNSSFAFSEVRLGLVPAMVMPFILAKTGHSAGRRWMVTGAVFSENEAKAIGLVHEILPVDMLFAECLKLAENIGKNSAHAMAKTKQLLHYHQQTNIDETDRIIFSAKTIALARTSTDGIARVNSFLTNR